MASPPPPAQEVVRAAMRDLLRAIRREDGFNTNAGDLVTLEPGYTDANSPPFLSVIVEKQVPSADPATKRTHRATTFAVIAKIPADQGREQEMVAAIVSDIETVLPGPKSAYPLGVSWPDYAGMDPIPTSAGAGWAGVVVRYVANTPIPNHRKT